MNAMSSNMWAGMAMIEEIDRGTLNRFLVSPARRAGIMNASVAERSVSTIVQSLIIVLLGLAGGAHCPGGFEGAAGVAVLIVASVLVGIVFGALSNAAGMMLRSREAIIGVYTFLMLPLIFLSSAFMQTALMPGWMQAIAARNPLNWVVQIGRTSLTAHPDWSAIAVRGGGLLALAVAFVGLSLMTFRCVPEQRLSCGGAGGSTSKSWPAHRAVRRRRPPAQARAPGHRPAVDVAAGRSADAATIAAAAANCVVETPIASPIAPGWQRPPASVITEPRVSWRRPWPACPEG